MQVTPILSGTHAPWLTRNDGVRFFGLIVGPHHVRTWEWEALESWLVGAGLPAAAGGLMNPPGAGDRGARVGWPRWPPASIVDGRNQTALGVTGMGSRGDTGRRAACGSGRIDESARSRDRSSEGFV